MIHSHNLASQPPTAAQQKASLVVLGQALLAASQWPMVCAITKLINAGGGNMPDMFVALAYLESGRSLLPISPDGSKSPATAWKPYQAYLPEASVVQGWYLRGYGLGIIGGAVGGYLEVLDFDAPGLDPTRGPSPLAGPHARVKRRLGSDIPTVVSEVPCCSSTNGGVTPQNQTLSHLDMRKPPI